MPMDVITVIHVTMTLQAGPPLPEQRARATVDRQVERRAHLDSQEKPQK